ncbi:hypothetical protein ACEQ8H_006308 [Pleosporales sp. CAS-2024a]
MSSAPLSDEQTRLLSNVSVSAQSRLSKHMARDVTPNWADVVLLLCYLITGLLDSAAVFIWGSFVSMQTGNTVYLGLGVVAPREGIRWVKAGTSIASFCLGSFAFARLHGYFSPRKRWVLVASYAFQLLCVVVAAVIVQCHGHKSAAAGLAWHVLVPIAVVAFQASGQAVTSRALQYAGLTSLVLTTNYCDLFSDPNLFARSNVERNRRLAAPALLLLGACLGRLWAYTDIGLAGALWTAVGLKALAVVAWLFWKAEAEAEAE